LKKSPDERYNSAYGLKRDLEICKLQFKSGNNNNNNISDFKLGTFDVLHRPFIPNELYSRDFELKQIIDSVNRVKKGNKELVVVRGVGKTSLVNSVKKALPIGPRFISGKYDQYNVGVPYSAITEALTEMVNQILVLSPMELEFYRDKLFRALGPNIGVIVEVIPFLELIVGPCSKAPSLPPSEAQNRFDIVFKDFLRVFSEEGHPLILFIDDLQRADPPSCRLIKLLLDKNNNIKYFLLITAFRENEMQDAFITPILEETNLRTTEIDLKPLQLNDINSLVSTSLRRHPNDTNDLSQVILNKTHGDPFFTIQFLKTLFIESLLYFDVQYDVWRWDMKKIQMRQFTDNVLEFMIENLKKLSPESQRVLHLAACIGCQFDFDILTIVSEHSEEYIIQLLTPIISQDLIIKSSEKKYNFVHDRVQQAAYSLVFSKHLNEIHLNIGRLLYKNFDKDNDILSSNIFDVVNQYNFGIKLISDKEETLKLAELNYRAGMKAKNTTAYAMANSYFQNALAHFDLENSWKDNYELLYKILVEKAECDFMVGNYEDSDKLLEMCITRANNIEDKGEAISLRVQQYTLLERFKESIVSGLEYLKSQGIDINIHASDEELLKEYCEFKEKIGNRTFMELLLPTIKQPPSNIKVCLKMMGIMIAPMFFTNISTLTAVLIRFANITVTHGLSSWSCVGLVMFALVACIGRFDDFNLGYDCGKFAMALKDMYGEPSTKGKVTMLYGSFINHWRSHISTNSTYIKQAFLESIEAGDLGYACYSGVHLIFSHILVGTPLKETYQLSKKYHTFMTQNYFKRLLQCFSPISQH